ncbi:MAG: metallophosphoesterase [Candidatus Hodarchaeales archaeon]
MVKIGIISDSHDNQITLMEACHIFIDRKVSYIFHCGDFISPFSLQHLFKTEIPLRLVLGNNDGEKTILHKLINEQKDCILEDILLTTEIESRKIAMTHGHISTVLNTVLDSGYYDIVLSGHNHNKSVKKLDNGTLHINPGELGGWLRHEATMAILDLKQLTTEFITLESLKKMGY